MRGPGVKDTSDFENDPCKVGLQPSPRIYIKSDVDLAW